MLIFAFSLILFLSVGVQVWQWIAALRFPIHKAIPVPSQLPGVTVLKPLKGADRETEACLRSWMQQKYPGALQILFGVFDPADPVVAVVRSLIADFPHVAAELIICPEPLGTNAKVSTLVQLRRRAVHPTLVVSDADVWIPDGFLAELAAPLGAESVGLVNAFYRLANPSTLAMRWEAVCINADFWSQVLQSISLQPQNYALGAAMAFRSSDLEAIGGFEGLLDHLADDNQLGRRIADLGRRIVLSNVVVECRDAAAGWGVVWNHQVRWNRTIRICQPLPYVASILSNVTLWALLLGAVRPDPATWAVVALIVVLRCIMVGSLVRRLSGVAAGPGANGALGLLAPVKDVLAIAVWIAALFGNRIIWRGTVYKVASNGQMVPVPEPAN